MDHDSSVMTRGYYALARYQSDPARGEFRNIAVLFVDEAGEFTGLRSIRPGSISRTVEEQGLVGNLIAGIEQRLRSSSSGIEKLRLLSGEYSHSILFSEPRPAVTHGSPQRLLDSLYLALVAPRTRASVGFTKGHVLDHLGRWVKTHGATLEIGAYADGHNFDGILRRADQLVCAIHVTSFAARQLNARGIEQEIGHFLFAAPRVGGPCIGVIQPAPDPSAPATRSLQEKVSQWFADAGVPAMTPAALRAYLLPQLGSDPMASLQLELVSSGLA
jgi:hypothetical protein